MDENKRLKSFISETKETLQALKFGVEFIMRELDGLEGELYKKNTTNEEFNLIGGNMWSKQFVKGQNDSQYDIDNNVRYFTFTESVVYCEENNYRLPNSKDVTELLSANIISSLNDGTSSFMQDIVICEDYYPSLKAHVTISRNGYTYPDGIMANVDNYLFRLANGNIAKFYFYEQPPIEPYLLLWSGKTIEGDKISCYEVKMSHACATPLLLINNQ